MVRVGRVHQRHRGGPSASRARSPRRCAPPRGSRAAQLLRAWVRVPVMARPMTLYAWEHTSVEKRPADAQVAPVLVGQVVMTRGVNDLVADHASLAELLLDALFRHRAGDWG